jgi:hypothetical protein
VTGTGCARQHGLAGRCGAPDGEIDRVVVDPAHQRQHFVEACILRRRWCFDGDRFTEDFKPETDHRRLLGRIGHGRRS